MAGGTAHRLHIRSHSSRVALSAAAALCVVGTAGAQSPVPESDWANRASVTPIGDAPFPGRLNANSTTGVLAVGRVGPGSGSWFRPRELDLGTGVVTDLGSRSIPDPDAVAWDEAGAIGPEGSILVGGVQGIYSVAPDGAVTLEIPRIGWVANPEDMRFDSQGRLIVADFTNKTVWRYNPATEIAEILAVFPRGILQFALDEQDNAYVVHPDGGIAAVAPTGGITQVVGSGAYTGVAKGPDHSGWQGAVYTCDLTTGELVRVFADGTTERLFTDLFAPVQPDPVVVAAAEAEMTFTPGGKLVVAVVSTGQVFTINDPCGRVDTNGNGFVEPGDFSAWIALFNAQDTRADADFSGVIEIADYMAWIDGYAACPRTRLR